MISAYVLVVYVTSRNMLYFLSTYDRFQSENKRETAQFRERESTIAGSVPVVYNCIVHSHR